MECRLQRGGRADVRVLNAGMSAYSSAHSLVRLQFDIVEHAPDMIIVMHNINDLTVNYAAAASRRSVDPNYLVKYGEVGYTGTLRESDISLSRLWNAARARLLTKEGVSAARWGSYDLASGRRMFERNLKHIAAIARANGIAVVFATMPSAASDSLYEYQQSRAREGDANAGPLPVRRADFVSDFAAYNESVELAARETDAALVPMHRLLGGDASLFVDVIHYSSAGSRAFGNRMAERIAPLLPAPRPGQLLTERVPACGWEKIERKSPAQSPPR
jgi:lysophospholipase L1-like esterase